MKNDVDMFTKAVFRYDHAVASFQVGLGLNRGLFDYCRNQGVCVCTGSMVED